jgi:hypothetical protein
MGLVEQTAIMAQETTDCRLADQKQFVEPDQMRELEIQLTEVIYARMQDPEM